MLIPPPHLPTLYPAYCFPLSPIHNAWAKLTAADLHSLQERPGFEGQNLYFYLNHPIKWVRLVGVIVAFDIYPSRWIMILDDGSGLTVEVVCGRVTGEKEGGTGGKAVVGRGEQPQAGMSATGRSIDLTGVDVGSVVKVKGGVGVFRGEKQLMLERLSFIHSTTEEAAAWAELSAFKDILSKPWILSDKEQARARRKAEGLDKHRERKAREERKREKLREKEKANRIHKEKVKRDGSGEREALQSTGNGTEVRLDGEPRRQAKKQPLDKLRESTVAEMKARRSVISGQFDALGL